MSQEHFCQVMFYTQFANGNSPEPFAIRAPRPEEADSHEDRTRSGSFRSSCPGSADGLLSTLPDSIEVSSQCLHSDGSRPAVAKASSGHSNESAKIPVPQSSLSAEDFQ